VIFSEDFFPDATTPNKNRFASESGVELKGRMVEFVYLTHDERKCDNMLVSARIDKHRKSLTIQLPLEKAHPSRSTGKTLIVASTHGCQTTEARHSGRPIVVTANAFIYAASRSKGKKQRVDRRSDSVRVDEATTGTAVSDRGKN
jgi:hypothetical protein